MDKIILDRFWSKTNKKSDVECWNWKGGINSTGRGIFSFHGKSIHAHRMSWILTYGEIPKGLWVLHHCDNGKCVNPKHLFIGTVLDNVKDMISKGRKVTLKGDDDPKSKLTERDVRTIRKLYKPKEFSQYKLAQLFGVSRSTIESVLRKTNWSHVI